MLGISNEFQERLSADETVDRNAFYFVEGLNYVPNSCYKVLWQRPGYEYKWIDQENFDTNEQAVTIQLLQWGHWGSALEGQDERVDSIVGLFAAS